MVNNRRLETVSMFQVTSLILMATVVVLMTTWKFSMEPILMMDDRSVATVDRLLSKTHLLRFEAPRTL